MKRIRRRMLVACLIFAALLPAGTAVALFGLGDSSDAMLAAIFAELQVHTAHLVDLFQGIEFLDTQVGEMRTDIDAPIDVMTGTLADRHDAMSSIITDTQDLYKLSPLPNFREMGEVMEKIERLWGIYGDGLFGKTLREKDFLPIYSMVNSGLIVDEAGQYSQAGKRMLDDLEYTTEGKATVRGAQAEAIQVQQLAQIEANQGLHIQLEAQRALSDTEKYKALQKVNETYMDMLEENLGKLKEASQR